MSTLAMLFLGPPAFERDGAPLSLVRAKGVALLVYLAASRVPQPRGRVLDLLWPESLPQAGRKNLRNTLWAIGEALGADVLVQDGATLSLAPSVAVDIHGLEDGLLLLESGAAPQLEAIVARYRGPLADGLTVHEAPEFELWLTAERERLAAVALRLLERLIGLARAAGRWEALLELAQRALRIDPLRETLSLAAIEAALQLGRRAQAIQQYALLREALRRELDVAPLPETAARYEALLAGKAAASPLARARPQRAEPQAPFVGRGAELALLDAELERGAAGGARVVMITGDLGMGKSRLWREWWLLAAGQAKALTAYALETHVPVPFGPVVALLRQRSTGRRLLELDAPLPRIWLAELARLLPELATDWPDLPPPLALGAAEERARLMQALTEWLRLEIDRPLVFVVDDLQWADPSTIDWLVHALDALRERPLLLIGTYREQDADERLLAAVAGWQRQGLLRTIALQPLAPAEAQRLLVGVAPAADAAHAAHWIRQSGGNPYFLLELLRSAGAEPSPDLRALVRARLRSTVPAAAAQVLQAAAVLGTGLQFEQLRAVSGRSEEETLDALDALVGAGVLLDVDGTFYFRHPLVAGVVRQELTSMRRVFLHRRAAETLARSSGALTAQVAGQLVEHYAAAGDTERAAHYADVAAGRALAVGAFAEAAAYARRAAGWAATAERHLRVGEALVWLGDVREAQQALETALDRFGVAEDPVGATRALLLLALMEIGRSEPLAARAWLRRAPLDLAQTADPALGAQGHQIAAVIERQLQSYAAAAAELAQAERLAHGERDGQLGQLAGMIEFERGNLLADQGDHQAALGAFGDALRVAERRGNTVHAIMARNNLAFQLLELGDLDAARREIAVAQELVERLVLAGLDQYVYSTAGEIAAAHQDWDTADGAYARAFEGAQRWENTVHMANVRANQALLALARGDEAAAAALVSAARTLFGAAVDPFVSAKIARAAALVSAPHASQVME